MNQAYAPTYSVGPGAVRRGRRAPAPAEQRPGIEHLRAGRVQPGLETRLRHQRARRPGPARLVLAGAGPRRAADRATGQPVPGGLRPAAGRVRHHRHPSDPVAAGLAKINAPTAEGAKIRDAIQEALQLKSYEFNAHGVELNQRYDSAAVIPDPTAGDEQWARDQQLYLQATTRPGAKLPHAWLVGDRRPPGVHPGCHRAGQVHPADRAVRAGLGGSGEGTWTCRSCAPS